MISEISHHVIIIKWNEYCRDWRVFCFFVVVVCEFGFFFLKKLVMYSLKQILKLTANCTVCRDAEQIERPQSRVLSTCALGQHYNSHSRSSFYSQAKAKNHSLQIYNFSTTQLLVNSK